MGIFRELAIYPRLLTRVLPLVERELDVWRAAARAIPDADLRAQALSSLERKKFHCVGGAVLALMAPDSARLRLLIRAIVAIQTISDYLDNLCDRSLAAAQVNEQPRVNAQGQLNAQCRPSAQAQAQDQSSVYQAYMRLHEAMLCAVDPGRPTVDYYDDYRRFLREAPGAPVALDTANVQDAVEAPSLAGMPPDGCYLGRLVEASRRTLRELPGYEAAKPTVTMLVTLYSELQAGKHLPADVRDGVMERWHVDRVTGMAQPSWLNQSSVDWLGHELRWWEFGAATGSTLAVFALICASLNPGFTEVDARRLATAYFPSICALHILLDYYIDQAEDVQGGDLNFVAHYPSHDEALEALEAFSRWSWDSASASTPDPSLHKAVVRGLLAMYLSDPKIEAQGLTSQARRLARAAGGITLPLKTACLFSRRLTGF